MLRDILNGKLLIVQNKKQTVTETEDEDDEDDDEEKCRKKSGKHTKHRREMDGMRRYGQIPKTTQYKDIHMENASG